MEKPKGLLVAVGGAENKGNIEVTGTLTNQLNSFQVGVLSKILQLVEAENKEPIIEIVTTASLIPEDMAAMYKQANWLWKYYNN